MSKHDDTLAAIYERPTRANVRWDDFASLVNNKGGKVTNGKGSRRRVELNGRKAVFHEPHPKPEIKKKALEAIRDFLSNAGVVP